MPIYEYECRKCGAHVEAFQKVNDKPLTKCGKCRGKLERKISAPAIQFKGSGWYVTDYAKKDQGGSAKSDDAKDDAKPSATSSEAGAKSESTEKSAKTEKSDKPADSSSSASSSSTAASPGTTAPPSGKSS